MSKSLVSTHSRPKAAGTMIEKGKAGYEVSTHSRPKAAGHRRPGKVGATHCFNTQPPEGGWRRQEAILRESGKFQHTAARRRLG